MSEDVIYLSSKNFIKRVKEIRGIVKENKADIIWSWGGVEATFGVFLSLTSSVNHINGSIRHGIVRFKLHQIWRLLVLHLSKNIVANSFAGLKANGIYRGAVLYNGIDDSFFCEPQTQSALIRGVFEIEEDVVLLASVANLVPYKDYDTVLKALSIIKSKGIPFHYIAIGEGPERRHIEGLVQIHNLSQNVTFPGNRSDIKDILYASDIFIHSSRGEGCSNAILEAMAVGLPIIASDTGGTREIVDNNVGRLFEFQNAKQLASLIMNQICNNLERELLAENSKHKAASNFSIERMMSNYYKIIEGVIK
ncbi:MAG: glycosyltransferase [Bacteroidales bacterium]|nr:glycosyltransferase [Bacteroidales bacterium]